MPDFAVIFEREREKLLAEVDRRIAQLRTTIAAQDDGVVVANDHRILNFQGPGVTVTDDPEHRRTNIFASGSPNASSTTTVISAAGSDKVFLLGSEPANWYGTGFDDSGWSAAVAMVGNNSANYTLPSGAVWISNNAGGQSVPATLLVRRTFALPAGSVTSATLAINWDDALSDLYLNGTRLGGETLRTDVTNPKDGPVLTISPGLLVAGGNNVLAAKITDSNVGTSIMALAWKLTVGLSVTGTDSQYIPYSLFDAAGDLLVGTGADTGGRVAKGSNGTFWGVSGGVAGYYTPTPTLDINGLTEDTTPDGDDFLPSYDVSASGNKKVKPKNLPAFTGDSGSGGGRGLVPAPGSGDAAAGKFLGAGGGWTTPSASAGGALSLISSQTLGAAAASVTFSSIPGTYKHLRLVAVGRGDAVTSSVSVKLQVNGDTGANYDLLLAQWFATNGTSIGLTTGLTSLAVGTFPAANATANFPGMLETVIPGYAATTFHKIIRSLYSYWYLATAGNNAVQYITTLWLSTAAVTSLTLTPSSGNFLTGCRFDLYGES